jgi:general secretion pathway protein K
VSGRERQRGIVLVTVLWSIALLSALAMAASVSFRGFAAVTAIGRDRVQGEALLTAGLEVAAAIVSNAEDNPLNGVETTMTLSTGIVGARVSDEGGRIDIGKAPVEVLAALLRAAGAPDQQADGVAAAIVQWRNHATVGPGAPGTDSANGANNGSSANGANTAGNADHPFADISELTKVSGVAPRWIAAIRELATVYGSETVNPLTAPAAVIAALPGVDRNTLAAFLAVRSQSPKDADRISAALGPAQRFLATKRQQVASVELQARLNDGYSTAAHAVVVVLPQDSQPYRVLVWKPLPPPTL